MKKLLLLFLFAAGNACGQRAEEAIKSVLSAEAEALQSHKPAEVRSYWLYNPKDTRHTIVSVHLPGGVYTFRTGADFVNDDAFPPAMPRRITNADYVIRTAGNLGYANYQTAYTDPKGNTVRAHRIVTLQKEKNRWKITGISEHYYSSK